MCRLPFALLMVLVFASTAGATTFQFTNVTTSDGILTGTLTLDPVTGLFTGINAAYISPSGTLLFTDPPAAQSIVGFAQVYFADFVSTGGPYYVSGGGDLSLILPYPSLIGYTGGRICTVNFLCNGVGTSVYLSDLTIPSLETGSLRAVEVRPIPEPSSLMLLGTGAIGLAGELRRRSVARSG